MHSLSKVSALAMTAATITLLSGAAGIAMTNQFNDLKQTASAVTDDAGSRLDSDLKTIREDITKLTATVTDLVKSQAATARSSVLGVMDDARGKVTDTASDARDRVATAATDLEATIERNPLLAVTAALVAGLFVGVLSRPRR